MLAYTKLKNEKRKNLRDLIPLAKPFTLIIEPSSLCNFRCTMCFQSTSGNAYFASNKCNMAFDMFQQIIRQMIEWDGDKLKVLKLSLYGEPFMNPLFPEMLSIARDANIAERIETTSNVSLLTPDISKGLVKGGLDYIRVSIYSPIQDKHEKITSSRVKIDTIHKNLETLQNIKRKLNSKTPFVAVKMLDTYGEENELFRDMYRDVADEIYIDKPHNWIATEEKNFIDSLYGVKNENVISDLTKQTNKNKSCAISFYTLSVRSNGDVAPCCVDWSGGTNVANIGFKLLKDIWQGESLRKFWRLQLSNRIQDITGCKSCQLYKSSYYSKDCIDGVGLGLFT